MNKKYKILSKINYPSDLKLLNHDELEELADDLSNYIHEVIYKLGGHYSSPLGVIELTIALHYVFNTPEDKLIWDVGHQAYAHKILTGRKEEFSKIRQFNGISGFLKMDESEFDSFGAGHTSTSISAALGFAHARDKKKSKEKVLAIIGDGAMTGGLAYEGLNNLGFHRTQLTIILNDNSYSISESVGALSKYLTKITTSPIYNKLREDIWKFSGKIPAGSNLIRKFLKKTEEGIKVSLTPGGFFEELGIRYIGPIDGNNIKELIKVFKRIKDINTPLLLHIHTNKSNRINNSFKDKDAIKYYSLSPKLNKKHDNQKLYSFSKVFGESIMSLAEDIKFQCITAAMKLGTGLNDFSIKYPNRYIDVGIAEQHALTYSSGLSASGIIPIIAIYSTFIQRAYDQIIHDLALQELPAIICMDRSGLVANDGPTHHGIFDISFLRLIPNIIVTAPANGYELHDLIYTALKSNKIFAIRYGKINTEYDNNYKPVKNKIGTWKTIQKGEKIAVLSVGSMVSTSIEVGKLLKNNDKLNITIYNCIYIKPLDTEVLKNLYRNHDLVVTIEEGSISGGFGSSILEYCSKNRITLNIKNIGIEDNFITHGSRSELLNLTGLSVNKIYNQIKIFYEEK